MKKMNLSLALLVFGFSFSASAKGIFCFKDDRPVDGNYVDVKLQKNGQTYDLTSTEIQSGFGGGPVEPELRTLASGLACNIDGLVAYCYKSRKESGDATNSVVQFSLIDETILNSLEQKGAKNFGSRVKIQVHSPQVDSESFEFEVKQKFGGCKNI